MSFHPSALKTSATILARTIRPRPPVRVSEWVAQNIVLVDGPDAGALWSPRGAPYLVDILDCLGESHPSNLVSVRKSQQTGASIAALAWALYIADREPANVLYAVPGIEAYRDLNSGKLQPLIEALQRHSGVRLIRPQVSRSGDGSKTDEKVFVRGGRLWLANAHSVMDLSGKTARKGIKDELSKWQPIPGAQDPEDLFFGRFTAFRGGGEWKILEISTPEYDTGDPLGEKPGHCRIDRSFKRSDQRFWHIACPECGAVQYQRFERFRVDEAAPHRSRYICEGCQHEISEAERRLALQPESGAQWIATSSGPDRHPGFHIDAFCSLMMSYEAIAEDWLKAKGSEIGLKGFTNLVLGLPFAFRGDAPDHEKLLARREAHLVRGHVPHDALIITAHADVQMRGIWLEIVAWTPDRRSYLVDAQYMGGDTDTHTAKVFERLRRETIDREFPDAFGRSRRLDAFGVDAGYRQHVVASFVRSSQTMHPDTGADVIFALKGEDGWGRPPLGLPKLVDIDLGGKRKIRQGVKLWTVGTWPLKSSVYTQLAKERVNTDFADIPAGYCHFPGWSDEEYFRQLTAEHLVDIMVRGVSTGKRWAKLREDNHFLDCRVGNLALFEHLTTGATPEQWAALARRRGLPDEALRQDLFTPSPAIRPGSEKPVEKPRQASAPSPADDWLGGRGDRWFNRQD